MYEHSNCLILHEPLSDFLFLQLRRIRATANHSREVPVVHMGRSVDEFFENIEKTSDAGRTLPTWHGELYLEVGPSSMLMLANSVFDAVVLCSVPSRHIYVAWYVFLRFNVYVAP